MYVFFIIAHTSQKKIEFYIASLEDMREKGDFLVLLLLCKENKAWLREHVSHFQPSFRQRWYFVSLTFQLRFTHPR